MILLNNGKHHEFDNVSHGIKEYRKLFFNEYDIDIQKVFSGNDKIKFYDVKLSNQILSASDSFFISMKCEKIGDKV